MGFNSEFKGLNSNYSNMHGATVKIFVTPVFWIDVILPQIAVHLSSHPSLYTRPYFAVSQTRGVAPKKKKILCHSDSSVDRSIRIVWHLEQVFEPHRMMNKHVKKGKKEPTITVFCTEEKNTEEIIIFWGGEGGRAQPDFRFSQGGRKARDGCIRIVERHRFVSAN